MLGVTVTDSGTGLDTQDSEIELKDSTLENNQRGLVARHSTLVLIAAVIKNSALHGITADECRIRFNACELTGNGGGARLTGGEGQILRSRFVGNRDVGMQLVGARMKIHQCLFADTAGDGIRMDDGRSVVWGSAFRGNSGYNLVNSGPEDICAVQNWWDNTNESVITAKLLDAGKEPHGGRITISPWLHEKPSALP
jgi:hypothetical protein